MFISDSNNVNHKNSYTIRGLPEKLIVHWLTAQIKIIMSVLQNIIQYEGKKKQDIDKRTIQQNYVQVQ